jgi:hypothetical protein
MSPDYLRRYIIPAAYALLPAGMASEPATAALVSIAWQESKLVARRQVRGPAVGLYQFEVAGGVHAVLGHAKTQAPVAAAMRELAFPSPLTPFACGVAIEQNDIVATVFARLLLWTLPGPLATRDEAPLGWRQYLAAWRPGKPRPEDWSASWAKGWAA